MKDHLERAAVALLKRVEQEAEGAVDLTGLADLANAAAKLTEAAQGKKETAGGTAVFKIVANVDLNDGKFSVDEISERIQAIFNTRLLQQQL